MRVLEATGTGAVWVAILLLVLGVKADGVHVHRDWFVHVNRATVRSPPGGTSL